MFTNYLKIVLRNLTRHRTFSIINILGLAVGITCFIMLALFALDEFGYDTFNRNADQIYRVIIHSRFMGQESNNSKTAAPLGAALKNDFPEILNYTRIGYFTQHDIRYKENVFREGDIYTADSTYFEIFTLPFVYGDPKTALVRPNSIVISETAAKKYFGNENPCGEQLIVDNDGVYSITGVMKDFPKKSHFSCNFLLSMSTYPENQTQNWLDLGYSTYVLLKKGTVPGELQNKMKNTVLEYVGPQAKAILGISIEEFQTRGNSYEYFLQPLTSIYMRSQSDFGIDTNTEWGNIRRSDITYSYIFLAAGSFILLIAIFNFMNLVTARSERRAKEVGIRKTLGSDKLTLMAQFITESVFICSLSVVLSLVLLQFILPLFNQFVGKELALEFFSTPYTIPLLILFTVIVGAAAGSYPAFYLSSFQPVHVMKSDSGKGSRKKTLRSVLVILQFAISTTLIIGTIIIKNQLEYIQTKDLGFKKEHLVIINNGSALGKRLEVFKQEIAMNPNVVSATASSLMFNSGVPGNGYVYDKASGTDVISCQLLDVDYDFIKTYQIHLKEGRYFSKEFSADTSAVVMNEAAAKMFNAKVPVGKTLARLDASTKRMTHFTIIGVVENFNYESLHQTVRPLVFHLGPVRQASTMVTIRVRFENIRETMRSLEKTWREFASVEFFDWTFLDQNLAWMYRTEEKIGNVITVFSFLAIFIACLGLFGLAAFVTEQRIKEIGIRKVLGASVPEIVLLLSKEFTRWVLLANLIAWPAAYYVMNQWLQDFAYRITMDIWVFIAAGAIALTIALATVAFQAIKAAIANPVESLRYE